MKPKFTGVLFVKTLLGKNYQHSLVQPFPRLTSFIHMPFPGEHWTVQNEQMFH